MFNINKFGAYISKLRKEKDMTQSELGDILNVSRQAVSKWELGESFPDISILPKLAEVFNVSIDMLVNAGEPYLTEGEIFRNVVSGTPEKVAELIEKKELSIDAVVNVAPVLKASTLDIIAKGFAKHGIDISQISELAAYMNEVTLTDLVKVASFDKIDEKMLAKFIPFMSKESREIIFDKILDGELSLSLLPVMRPYMDHNFTTLIEAAVLEGYLDPKALDEI